MGFIIIIFLCAHFWNMRLNLQSENVWIITNIKDELETKLQDSMVLELQQFYCLLLALGVVLMVRDTINI